MVADQGAEFGECDSSWDTTLVVCSVGHIESKLRFEAVADVVVGETNRH